MRDLRRVRRARLVLEQPLRVERVIGAEQGAGGEEKRREGHGYSAAAGTPIRSNSVGVAFQGGIDIDISPKVFLNFDIKYITMGTNATLTTGALVNQVDVDINPLVFGFGIGTRF